MMIWVDHSKAVLQNKSTYLDDENKIYIIESSSDKKEYEMYIFQSNNLSVVRSMVYGRLLF